MKINPNHPLASELNDEFLQKVVTILVMKAGGKLVITPGDFKDLETMCRQEKPVMVTDFEERGIEFRLVPRSEAMSLAREAGGLPA